MQVFTKLKSRYSELDQRLRDRRSPPSPVYVFHHIPKCGGTSLNAVLENWFTLIRDYRVGYTDVYPTKTKVETLRSAHCLCGHFEMEGYYLHQRYPEVLEGDRYRIFTFVRDPLELQLSLYRYAQIHNPNPNRTLATHLALRPNYIASLLPATLETYKEVIDRYFFVGVLEQGQKSLNQLAQLIDKPPQNLPWENRTQSSPPDSKQSNSKQSNSKQSDSNQSNSNQSNSNQSNSNQSDLKQSDLTNSNQSNTKTQLTAEQRDRFHQENVLDYLIYQYCLEKLENSQPAKLSGH